MNQAGQYWKTERWLAGALSASVGVLVLIGWAFDIPVFKSVGPGWVSMKANTALGFVLLGLAMMAAGTASSTFRVHAGRFCALTAGAIGALTLGEYITGVSLGIDQLLFTEPAGAVATADPGRMAPDTALCFSLMGAALSLPAGLRSFREGASLAAVSGVLATAMGLSSLASVILPAASSAGWWGKTGMAVHTAGLFVALGAACVAGAMKDAGLFWDAHKRVTAVFAGALALVLSFGFLSHRNAIQLVDTNREVLRGEEHLQLATRVLSVAIRAQTIARGYVISGDGADLKELLAAQSLGREKSAALLRSVSGIPSEEADAVRLVGKAEALIAWQTQVVSAHRAGRRPRPEMVAEGDRLRGELLAAFERMEAAWRQAFKARRNSAADRATFVNRIGFWGLLLELTVILFAWLGLTRSEMGRWRYEEALRERNAELVRFSYTVSHDLKSPLVTIKTFLGYLEQDLRKQDEAAIAKDLGFIHKAADKMARLLDELLNLSRVGRKMNPPVEVSLQELAEEAFGLVAGRIAKGGVEVWVTPTPVLLRGERQRLVEVFQNLVDNAAKFMGTQARPRIEVGVEARGSETVLFVRDNGIGIDPRHRHKLFGLFEKLEPGTEGTGIGLALVRRIVEVHGGRIWVESEGPGKGAAFLFTLRDVRRLAQKEIAS